MDIFCLNERTHSQAFLLLIYVCYLFISVCYLQKKLSEIQLKPWQLGAPQSLDRWTVFFAAVTPALAIVRTTLSLIIQARGSEVCFTWISCPHCHDDAVLSHLF